MCKTVKPRSGVGYRCPVRVFKWGSLQRRKKGVIKKKKMDLAQTFKLFVQQHLECIGLVRPGETPWGALNIRTFNWLRGE